MTVEKGEGGRGPILSPWRGDKVVYAMVVEPARRGYIGWRTGTTTLCLSRLYPPVMD
jgi:hypothetical protein